ncbi:hypothetical protein [Granulicella aggregans]|uniref:hypothetical protein n=1 Tax=Granulicella aggregans TaxID=474949 RepID=UPI0021DF83D9|nr:hypothetical protein [Granulicella aggregans]
MNRHTISGWLVLAISLVPIAGISQTKPSLTILSPASGTSVNPGQTINVEVEATGFVHPASEAIEGPDMASSIEKPLKDRNTFQLTIPSTVEPGATSVHALAILEPGSLVYSEPLELKVAVTFAVEKLTINNKHLGLSFIGDQTGLDVRTLTNPVGGILQNESLTFKSLNPSVAIVDSNGIVTATGLGITQVIVSHGAISDTASVVVKHSGVRGDLTGDGKVDSRDIDILEDWQGAPAVNLNDTRDLNHDGVIDEKDLEIERTLCTYPNCATHN